MDRDRFAELLLPFLRTSSGRAVALSAAQLAQFAAYLALLLRWNQKMNLSSVRDPEQIVTRHFGESLFAAIHLLGFPPAPPAAAIDVGSGAGFPGLPFKIYAPALRLTLIESISRKATFLKEVIRTNTLANVDVFAGRAGDFPARAALVTSRAVERFETMLPVAGRLVEPDGRLALLIGSAQISSATRLLPGFRWDDPVLTPQSSARVILVGTNQEE